MWSGPWFGLTSTVTDVLGRDTAFLGLLQLAGQYDKNVQAGRPELSPQLVPDKWRSKHKYIWLSEGLTVAAP